MTRVAIAKWGNNLALRLPKSVVEALGVKPGSQVALEVRDRTLRATPLPKRPSLDELVRKITPKNRHEETSWGPPVGREVW